MATRRNLSGGESVRRTCFISAPAGAPLGVLRAALESRGLRVLVPEDLAVGTDWASEVRKQLSRADLVVGVVASERESPWVFFELGQASALGRRILLIVPPKADPFPFPLHELLVLRVELDNQEAIGFALDQVLSAPDRPARKTRVPKSKPLAGIGDKADELMAILERSLSARNWRGAERVVAEALRSSGADVVVGSNIAVTPEKPDVRADLAVWSDVLEPFVGNPLLVEVKARIRDKRDAQSAIWQLISYLDASGSRWALLLYGDGPDPESLAWAGMPPNVLVLQLRALFEALRTRAFPELVRDLRNRRVHGSIS